MPDSKPPLGQDSAYPCTYSPDLLCPIARNDARQGIGICADLPFHGTDVWNAWDLTWLGAANRPAVATAQILVPADSPNLIESKSLKLYLNSFSMSQFDGASAVAETIAGDLGACLGAPIEVRVTPIAETENDLIARLAGTCIDFTEVQCSSWEVDAGLLQVNDNDIVTEDLHSHLLRSECPVTSQPDIGSVQIRYRGPRIAPESLLRYIVSFRQHKDFHEACIERMFVDIVQRCKVDRLSIYGRYQRRGGIDINPFRSNFEDCPRNLRLWRQ